MHVALNRVLESFATRSPNPAWIEATSLVLDERALVDASLASADAAPVYGFTTRLGHEDSLALSVEEQRDLLRDHLVGPASWAPAEWRHLLAATKAEQLHHGGSGVHPDAYRAVLGALGRGGAIEGNWVNSYSCGDVVPGAWFAADLLADHGDLLTHPGDLITIINGHYISTSLSLVATASLARSVAALLAAWLPGSGAAEAQPLSGAPSQWQGQAGASPLQAPISLRDPDPVLAAVNRTFGAIGAALEARLGSPSCNPRFAPTPAGVRAVSQSSFLDYELTFALTNALQLAALTAGLWQRLIQHRCDQPAGEGEVSHRIQAPKTAQGLVERVRLAAQLPTAFSGFDSQGIEDLRDLSLSTAQMLSRLSVLLGDFEEIWATTGARVPAADVRQLTGLLLGRALAEDCAATPGRTIELAAVADTLIGLRAQF
jgi:hypothetical protein